jgi:hypothetical protein
MNGIILNKSIADGEGLLKEGCRVGAQESDFKFTYYDSSTSRPEVEARS